MNQARYMPVHRHTISPYDVTEFIVKEICEENLEKHQL